MIKEKMIRLVVYPAFQMLKQRTTMELLQKWEELHLNSRKEIEDYQSERLREMIHHAANNVLYYQKRFREDGIHPDRVHDIHDIQKLPLLSKETVRLHPEQLISRGFKRGLEEVRTGGSTGEPMTYFMGQDAFSANQAVAWRSRRWFGMDIGQPHILIWGHSASFGGGVQAKISRIKRPVKDWILNRRTLSAYNLSEKHLASYVKTIRNYAPQYMRGYASTFYVLASYIEENESPLRFPGLKAIICTSEVLYDWQKRVIERVFECPVVNEYGSNETGVMAYSCPEGNLHVMEENVILEVVKNNDGGPDDVGEIVVTQLQHKGAPLIRYRIGDVARGFRSGCACGSNLKILDGLVGRTYDLIHTPDGRFVHGQLFHHILRQPEAVKKFQVRQKSDSALEIKIVLDGNSGQIQEDVVEKQIKNVTGNEMSIDFAYVHEIPLEKSGKFRWIISEISHQKFRESRS